MIQINRRPDSALKVHVHERPAPPSGGDGEQDRKPPSRSEEARLVVEEYAKDLAEI
ncbi:hypothetical protein IVB57_24120 [Bradyrhizobium sp. CW9]|uniref:hypothetical protein n=1 Tax=Bradyrhizobium sp. CW9 TaxID=2782689 RepID=UPI001FFAFD14|nr:hypothetical protein [Bradyrhizobium sp. CW9]MCK1331407.1 hypothetical protein [Bradyrhizobium sp. CW9]